MDERPDFRAARQADWPAIEALLKAAALPPDGAREHLLNFIVGEVDGKLCCVAGFEQYEQLGLLRSVAVSGPVRGRGVGERLLDAVKRRAKVQGISTLYLLTTTASPYFAARGFAIIERAQAPVALHTSLQFKGACPASATTMAASLNNEAA